MFFILQPITNSIIQFLTSDLPADFFDNSYIKNSLVFFQWLGGIIFAFSCLLLISSIVESRAAGEYISYKTIFSNIFNGFLLLVFSEPLVVWSFKFAQTVTFSLTSFISLTAIPQDNSAYETFVNSLSSIKSGGYTFDNIKTVYCSFFGYVGDELTNACNMSGNSSLLSIIMFICSIAIFFQLMTLYGMYYIQIVTGYFYIADAMRGNLSAIEDWLRDIVASGITFMTEYLFFMMGGMMIISSSTKSPVECAPGLVLFIAAPAIPTALKKWGYNHSSSVSARGIATGLGRAAAGSVTALTHI